MSPIRSEQRDLYPVNWKAISFRIRFGRAAGRCECHGECGSERGCAPGTRCVEVHGQPAQFARGKVVLTVAHLDHDPRRCDDENLKAYCQRCHLTYDRSHHAETRKARA